MNKLYTALRLIRLLNERKKINSKIVAEELEVSIRTAQRYLQELQVLPGITYDENDKSYKLLENYRFEGTILSQTELYYINALFDFISRDLNEVSAKYIENLKKKIFHLNSLTSPVSFLYVDNVEFDKISPVLSKLEQAIKDKQRIKFFYKRYNRDYTVNPYKIVLSEGFWYLVGEHDDVLKKFLVDQIEKLNLLDSFFVPKMDVDKLLNSANNIWFSEDEKDDVVIKVDKIVADYFRRKKCLTGQIIESDLGDGLVVRFTVFNDSDFIYQIIRWAPYIEVISPKKYKEVLREYLINSLRKISDDRN
ncbi:WYL domain-containing transcriptional regulator [Deferribacter autotrophicus]|uniref:WYL domain-containing transcriptional regulator n=1 Tax=Deferribacter autotrophicus TaxID=500465 RepID=A0A5A8F0C1_9BACT|nr:WYL domain-containing transcriptional regulator [Deferribacter autotrophicus]KAA0257288.1 WYL domain-containing transcriptional regulator [Deferribacter autotrophicus]